ncbi:U2 snRNP-associated protein Sap155 [Schizosaccharomyces cryophilus OY26]|uniref:U2 snRNP-associated protein Sap155 n=1 Tax=Schizosaccharomyces cryophilus (strain OY26 / ATCC MYA-4695 / CBS 11777 / NBRC 106824 / NRRL Y48691) TaxID=653667 RepID=S9X4F7_SCHCR|nr:U2 snRNP-associated protein Sap155 [Schizosaccharomyces cryophilus OY26]EPY51957.1 U2 snRNP-associated protein Sap155 [Schizosaccharomyces cryophilus OY26]
MSSVEDAELENLRAQREQLRKQREESKNSVLSKTPSIAGTLDSHRVQYDTHIYNTSNVTDGYDRSIDVHDDAYEENEEGIPDGGETSRPLVRQYEAPKELLTEYADVNYDPMAEMQSKKQIQDRESDYQKQRFQRRLAPTRNDAFREDGKIDGGRSYADAMREVELEKEESRVYREINQRRREGTLEEIEDHKLPEEKKRTVETIPSEPAPKPKRSRWDQGPPKVAEQAAVPTRRSRWDKAPDAFPISDYVAENGVQKLESVSQEKQVPIHPRITDEELNSLLPSEGYVILEPPEGYLESIHPQLNEKENLVDTYHIPQEQLLPQHKELPATLPTEIPGVGDLAFFKQEDVKYFGKLLQTRDEAELSIAELRERKILRLLLKVKNGTPPMRKSALRQLTDQARDFGAAALFNQILPLLMERTLEDQERHLLVKVIDRILYKLDELVRPFTHKILVVIEPLLIDEDYYARAEGREIISNLAKASGLAHMIATMRPDIDHVDEYVRNTTARAFSVVASALGVPALLPFLKAVCRSKKSWQARHTGVRIIQQIALLMGCSVLPHLKSLVECIGHGLEDEQQKVRTMTALALSALAEAATPYGIEAFDSILKPLWSGVQRHRGKSLAAFLKATGFIIPLMEPEYASHFTKRIMKIVLREFSSPDEEMKKIVLKVVSQCASTDGVNPEYLKTEVLPEFFHCFWSRRMASDRRSYKQVVETTVVLAGQVGVLQIVDRIVNNFKDESEPYRKMTAETVDKVIGSLGVSEIDERMEELLLDGVLFAFQEQSVEEKVILNCFSTVVNSLGVRCKPYLPQIVSTVLYRLNNKSANVREQAADLVSRITVVMRACGEEALIRKLGVVLYEYLGEEYPEVLGSILGSLKAIVSVVGMSSMQPPIKDLLPRLTPILRNRHEKVQENTIDLVGRIADRGSEFVSAREWMRICFELIDMLKAHKKSIRRAAINTFGYISKAIGPQDVLATLLNNLKVQERQNRVCTTVAIAIVAETCMPFTVIPALMADYRTPEMNVQNGVLKSLAFMFEYIGEQARDYVYAITPLLANALMDRDAVHRQTAASVVKHLSLGCVGLGVEDAMIHLLNLLWPNILEESPHVINAVREGIDGIRNCVGVGVVLAYLLQGLFHPSRKVRNTYWTSYNSAYVQSADAMVPYYPHVEDDQFNSYELKTLHICI